MNNEQNRRSKSDFPSKSLVDSIKSITFAPTRTRQASSQCLNRRVVLFLYDEQQNPIPETIRPMLPNRMTGSWITLPTDALRIYFDLCIIKYFLNIISMTPMTMTPMTAGWFVLQKKVMTGPGTWHTFFFHHPSNIFHQTSDVTHPSLLCCKPNNWSVF